MQRRTLGVVVLLLLALSAVESQPKTEPEPEEKASNDTAPTSEPGQALKNLEKSEGSDAVDKEPETKTKSPPVSKSKSKTKEASNNSTSTSESRTHSSIDFRQVCALEETKLPTSSGCGAGCEICHENHCFSCRSDFQRIDYKCEKKGCSDPRCKDCSAEVCYKCIDGFAPDIDGFCKWIGPTGCQEKNCMLCEQTRIQCTECMAGFQLRSNRCLKKGHSIPYSLHCCAACKDKNCLRCSSNGKKCELCKEGFQTRLGECLEVGCLDDHCRQCSPSGGSCYHCIDGYYADLVSKTCKSCPDSNCINCSGSQQSCLKCVDGYYPGRLSTGKMGCVECDKAVDHCDACNREGDQCFSCISGYYLEHGHCIECPTNCADCKSPWLCDQCKDGFDLYSNGLCQGHPRIALFGNFGWLAGQNASLKSNGIESHVPGFIMTVIAACLLIAALL